MLTLIETVNEKQCKRNQFQWTSKYKSKKLYIWSRLKGKIHQTKVPARNFCIFWSGKPLLTGGGKEPLTISSLKEEIPERTTGPTPRLRDIYPVKFITKFRLGFIRKHCIATGTTVYSTSALVKTSVFEINTDIAPLMQTKSTPAGFLLCHPRGKYSN